MTLRAARSRRLSSAENASRFEVFSFGILNLENLPQRLKPLICGLNRRAEALRRPKARDCFLLTLKHFHQVSKDHSFARSGLIAVPLSPTACAVSSILEPLRG